MYKVFVNEKKLTISKNPIDVEKRLQYEGIATMEIAMDILENTSCPEINVFSENIDEMWDDFRGFMKIVNAAGGIVFNENNDILFIYRIGKWDLPKGKIEKNESLEQAAVREVEEETGLADLTLVNFIDQTYHIYTERDNTKILKTTYWFKMSFNGTTAPIPQVEEGITEVKWMNRNEVIDTVFPRTFKNIKLILNKIGISEN